MSVKADASGFATSQTLTMAWLKDLPDAGRDRVRAIYEEAFPARQREPFAELAAASTDGEPCALAGIQDGQPVGLASFSSLHSIGWRFLEYFAVDAGRRGAGLGRALWKAAAAAVRGGDDDPRPVVFEVEDPAEPGIGAAERAARERRIRFWGHVGARPLPVEGYVVPNIDGSGVEPMLLMWVPPSPADADPDGAALLALVLALYRHGYGLDDDDPLVERARTVLG